MSEIRAISFLSQALKYRATALKHADNAEVGAAARKLVTLLEEKADLEMKIAAAAEELDQVMPKPQPKKKRARKPGKKKPAPQDLPPPVDAK